MHMQKVICMYCQTLIRRQISRNPEPTHTVCRQCIRKPIEELNRIANEIQRARKIADAALKK